MTTKYEYEVSYIDDTIEHFTGTSDQFETNNKDFMSILNSETKRCVMLNMHHVYVVIRTEIMEDDK